MYHWRPGGGLPPFATHSSSTSLPEVATKAPVNGEDSPGSLKWTAVGGAEKIIHEFDWIKFKLVHLQPQMNIL